MLVYLSDACLPVGCLSTCPMLVYRSDACLPVYLSDACLPVGCEYDVNAGPGPVPGPGPGPGPGPPFFNTPLVGRGVLVPPCPLV